jgi:hypothetical protein
VEKKGSVVLKMMDQADDINMKVVISALKDFQGTI